MPMIINITPIGSFSAAKIHVYFLARINQLKLMAADLFCDIISIPNTRASLIRFDSHRVNSYGVVGIVLSMSSKVENIVSFEKFIAARASPRSSSSTLV